MKNRIKILVIFFLIVTSSISSAQLNIISYNIRMNTPGDGENAWPHRKDNVFNLLKFHKADIFCLQEVLYGQLIATDSAFRNFSYVGVGRDDGIAAGEFSPVFYNKERFKLLDSGNFWLAENPKIPALGWDAACIRICSWASLEEKDSRKNIMIFNTHFDHVGVEARKNAADLIIKKIKELSGGSPVILCGDFNLPPESIPIKKISAFLYDANTISELPPHGPTGSWSGFTYDDEPGKRIDYIFVSEGITVKRYGILADARNRKFFSDHLPVLVELDF